MARGKTVTLYLMDGEATGKIKCSLSNWTGIVYKIPRTAINSCKDNSDLYNELQQSGIYFLFGTDEKKYNEIVYVGQAVKRKNGKGLLSRVLEPHNFIDWVEAVFFTTANDSFGSTEVSYLENRFCNLVKDVGRSKVINSVEPNLGNVTEEKECELEEFIDYAKIVMGALGHKIFEPLISNTLESEKDQPLLYMERKAAKAKGKRTSDGFVVLKGSTINPETTKSCPESVLKAREIYADKISKANRLTSDILFKSPSAAAGFVSGSSMNGMECWQDAEGRVLKSLE